MNRRGISLYEIIALVLLIIAAYIGDMAGSRFHSVLGIVGMVVFPLVLIFCIERLAWLERELIIGQKPLPDCRCGREKIDCLPLSEEDNGTFHVCRCGRKYSLKNRGRIMMIENGNECEFACWRPFKGWSISDDILCRRQ
jgi:hypothetical protein